MNKRERTLMLGSIAALAVFGYFQFSGSDDDIYVSEGGSGFFGVSREEVEMARENYESTVEVVVESPRTVQEFARLTGDDSLRSFKDKEEGAGSGNNRPDLEFQKDVADWCREVGFPSPDVSKKVEDIRTKDNKLVMDYQLVIVTINIRDGDLPRIAQLLKVFEQRGLIIQELDMSAPNDSEELSAMIVVARLVDYFYPTRDQKRARS
ncbi:MAG: hypothetical protein PWP23_782 [Candidatus Sumerlaeota bacterium]|nr:hypothetical protein [Candidatus Sumerlaeota bacterium]